MIKPVLTALQMVPIHDAVSIRLRERLDAAGVLHPDEAMNRAAGGLIERLRVVTDALVPLRTEEVLGAAS